MFNFFKKTRTKTGEVKMEENITKNSNQDINNDTISQIFRGLDAEYDTLKQAIAREFSDYEDMLARERKQATIYKNKVQVRDVMEEILPVLSEMRNDAIDSTDLIELKTAIQSRYKQLFIALSKVGIKVQMHERNQPIAIDEKVNGSSKKTTDPNLHQKVACSNKMGCIIKGEEDNPILEDVEIYVCKREVVPNSYDTYDEYTPIQEKESTQTFSSEQPSAYQCDEKDVHQYALKTQEQQVNKKPNAILHRGQYVQFITPVVLIKPSNQKITLFPPERTIVVSESWQKLNNIPQIYINQESCNIYLGTQLLSKEFSLENVELYYRVTYDRINNSLFLEFGNGKTQKQFVKHQLTFINN